MRKFRNKLTYCCLAACVALFAVACGNNKDNMQNIGSASDSKASEDSYVVTFDYNYEGADSYTETVNAGAAATPPAAPDRTGYAFTGWYDEAAAENATDFEVAITKDITIYAGWEQTGTVVTLNPNYDGGTEDTMEVEVGTKISTPEALSRDGYVFTGWYTDESATTEMDFTTSITDSMTLYAGWAEDDGTAASVTYHWNIEDKGIYDTVKVPGTVSYLPVLNLEGYVLEGWYKDEACTEDMDFSAAVTEDIDVYAKWLGVYTFEAEYTDLTGLEGMGYSGNASGTNMIETDTKERGASNGYYVGWLYNEGLTLTFHVNSAEAAEAELALVLSAEYYDITLTPDTYTVEVNGTKVDYDDISFTNAAKVNLPFATYAMNRTVPLNEGDNVITLTVTNNEAKTGTIYASAPLVDCIYLYSPAELSWGDGFPLESNIK